MFIELKPNLLLKKSMMNTHDTYRGLYFTWLPILISLNDKYPPSLWAIMLNVGNVEYAPLRLIFGSSRESGFSTSNTTVIYER